MFEIIKSALYGYCFFEFNLIWLGSLFIEYDCIKFEKYYIYLILSEFIFFVFFQKMFKFNDFWEQKLLINFNYILKILNSIFYFIILFIMVMFVNIPFISYFSEKCYKDMPGRIIIMGLFLGLGLAFIKKVINFKLNKKFNFLFCILFVYSGYVIQINEMNYIMDNVMYFLLFVIAVNTIYAIFNFLKNKVAMKMVQK